MSSRTTTSIDKVHVAQINVINKRDISIHIEWAQKNKIDVLIITEYGFDASAERNSRIYAAEDEKARVAVIITNEELDSGSPYVSTHPRGS